MTTRGIVDTHPLDCAVERVGDPAGCRQDPTKLARECGRKGLTRTQLAEQTPGGDSGHARRARRSELGGAGADLRRVERSPGTRLGVREDTGGQRAEGRKRARPRARRSRDRLPNLEPASPVNIVTGDYIRHSG